MAPVGKCTHEPHLTCDARVPNRLRCVAACSGGGKSGPEHCTAFREALDMRYHFIPYVYSLAHIAHEELRPIARPAIFEFPEWKSSDPEDEDVWGTWHTYMFGSHIVTGESA